MTFVEAAEAGDAPDAGDAAPNKAALLRSWNPNSDPELEEHPRRLEILLNLVLLQFVLLPQRDP